MHPNGSFPLSCRLSMARTLRSTVALALWIVTAQVAVAQVSTSTGDTPTDSVGAPNGSTLDCGEWTFVLGAGAMNGPRYPGSSIDFTRGLPDISAICGRYYFGGSPGGGAPPGIGAYLVRTDHWTLGLDLAGDFRKTRRETDAPILHGWGDIPGTVWGGMFASYRIAWISVEADVAQGAHHEGLNASLSLQAQTHPTYDLTVSFGPKLTWTNGQYAMKFFGIDTPQSVIAGVPPYQVAGGMNMIGGEATARYALTSHWSLAGFVTVGDLQGDAARSPVTADKTQREFGGLVLYLF